MLNVQPSSTGKNRWRGHLSENLHFPRRLHGKMYYMLQLYCEAEYNLIVSRTYMKRVGAFAGTAMIPLTH